MKAQFQSALILLLSVACSRGFKDGGDGPNGNGNNNDSDDSQVLDSGDTGTPDDTDTDTDTDASTGDIDGDGFSEDDGDCDDDDASVSPDAEEIPYDGIDNDCDESTPDDDLDGDGVNADEDCDDEDATSYPDNVEDWTDGIDNDCDGQVDEWFSLETVESSCDCGSPSALGVSDDGVIHVAFFNADNGTVDYVVDNGTGWESTETVVDWSYATAGEYLDGAVDSEGRFHLGYTWYDHTYSGETELDYIYLDTDGLWSSEYIIEDESVAEATQVGFFVSVDVDTSDLPSFAYMDYTHQIPVMADILDDPWSSLGLEVLYADIDENYMSWVGEDCDIGFWTSIAVDTSGYDHVAYFDDCSVAQEAQYTKLDTDLDTLAFSETIENDGWYTSIALMSDATPCVAMQTSDEGELLYGCSSDAGETWSIETVDETGAIDTTHAYYMATNVALAINSQDEPVIAYYDVENGDLLAATLQSGTWYYTTVDTEGDVGTAIDIAIDDKDMIHLTYFDVTNQALKYAITE